MSLSKDETETIKRLVAEGKSLGEVQKALQDSGVMMTYMELRFLVDDLGLTLQEKPRQKTVPPMPAAASSQVAGAPLPDESDGDDDSGSGAPLSPEPSAGAGGVSVSIDSIVRPGCVVSGEVTFSDGIKVQWSLDQFGRLGLLGAPKGYKPNPADIQEFQTQLKSLLESRGGI
jgi:hypothetical protein